MPFRSSPNIIKQHTSQYRVVDLALNQAAKPWFHQYLDPSVALFPKMYRGQICNLAIESTKNITKSIIKSHHFHLHVTCFFNTPSPPPKKTGPFIYTHFLPPKKKQKNTPNGRTQHHQLDPLGFPYWDVQDGCEDLDVAGQIQPGERLLVGGFNPSEKY